MLHRCMFSCSGFVFASLAYLPDITLLNSAVIRLDIVCIDMCVTTRQAHVYIYICIYIYMCMDNISIEFMFLLIDSSLSWCTHILLLCFF